MSDSDGAERRNVSIFGRERAMIDGLAKRVHKMLTKEYPHTDVRERRRGSYFEVEMADGRVASITIELDRVLPEEKRSVPR